MKKVSDVVVVDRDVSISEFLITIDGVAYCDRAPSKVTVFCDRFGNPMQAQGDDFTVGLAFWDDCFRPNQSRKMQSLCKAQCRTLAAAIRRTLKGAK